MQTLNASKILKSAAAVGVVALTCVAVSAGRIAAAPQAPDSNGAVPELATRVEITLDPSADAVLIAREGRTRDALGFPVGARRIGHHVVDGFENAEYDEVTELDSAGNVESVTQFDSKGRLRGAVRVGPAPAMGVRLTQAGAVKSAEKSALAAGLAVGTPTSTEADQATGGWTVHWARTQNGVRVRGDETRAQVWPDGRIQSVARAEHDLAVAPASRISSDSARQISEANLERWFAGGNSGYTIQRLDLEWVGPNAAFDPAGVAAAEAPYRLAWVAEVKPSGDAANAVWLISLFVDAGDGALIGGDFVE